MTWNNNYSAKGFGTLDGEPVYFNSDRSLTFLKNGTVFKLRTDFFTKHADQIGDVKLRSGWVCSRETGVGRYVETNPTRSFSALPNLKALSNSKQSDITDGGLNALFTNTYPHIVTQFVECIQSLELGYTKTFPISTHIAITTVPAYFYDAHENQVQNILRIVHKPSNSLNDEHPVAVVKVGEGYRVDFLIDEEYPSLSLLQYELDRVFNSTANMEPCVSDDDDDEGEPYTFSISTISHDDMVNGRDPTREEPNDADRTHQHVDATAD